MRSAAAYGEYAEPHHDLREFLARVRDADELTEINDASWDLEMGTLAEVVYHDKPDNPPALLFNNIPGFPDGFRALSGATNSARRLAITLGLPRPSNPLDVVRSYRERMKEFKNIPPRLVQEGPVLENIQRDEQVDLFKFPVPRLHEHDGGRYIGTDDLVVVRDPDEGWVNVGTYRAMLHDRNTIGMWMSPGKHGRQIREKYFRDGKPCPVLISVGHDPLIFLASGNEIRSGLSEYDYAGGHRGHPIDVVESELHGLPMPARSEIVLEGLMYPNDTRSEGPFGEFTGYYARGESKEPVVHVQRVYHRHDPILTIASPMRPPSDFSFSKCVMKSGMIWDEIERAGLSGVKAVWCHEAGGARMFNVVALRQAYPGHARQAALLAASCQSGSYLGRYVVVVDEDVDPTDTFGLLWAISTRADPAKDIMVFDRAWSGPLDPLLDPESRTNSRAIIDACRPFEKMAEFPRVVQASAELRAQVEAKFAKVLANI